MEQNRVWFIKMSAAILLRCSFFDIWRLITFPAIRLILSTVWPDATKDTEKSSETYHMLFSILSIILLTVRQLVCRTQHKTETSEMTKACRNSCILFVVEISQQRISFKWSQFHICACGCIDFAQIHTYFWSFLCIFMVFSPSASSICSCDLGFQ